MHGSRARHLPEKERLSAKLESDVHRVRPPLTTNKYFWMLSYAEPHLHRSEQSIVALLKVAELDCQFGTTLYFFVGLENLCGGDGGTAKSREYAAHAD
jgi:hypothetical protein